jgi:hypothetical protein
MKYLHFTFKREATILVALHFGILGVGIVLGIARYVFGFTPK